MKFISVDEPSDALYVIPIGDVHVGDKAFGKEGRDKLKGYIDWVLARDNARIFLMGDVYNVASRSSKTSPFESDSKEYQEAIDLFEPVKDKIIGAITGNHERRMEDHFGFNPLVPFAAALGIPYLGLSAVIRLRVGKLSNRGDKHGFNQVYHIYAHHTTGGGGTIGNALNRSAKLQDIVQGVDVYMGGHNHNLATGVRTIFTPGQNEVLQKRVAYVDTGSYLDYAESYAEAGMFAPGKLGSPRIRFSGVRDNHDVHVNI